MSRLDDELKRTFRRRQPSGDFAERVMARIALQQASPQPERSRWWQPLLAYLNPFDLRSDVRRGQMRLATVGAVVCLIVATVGVHGYRERQRTLAEGEMARAQVIFAFQIASSKLNAVQRRVQLLGEEPVGDRTRERVN